MSKLAKVAKSIWEYEIGAEEWPGFKRETRYLFSNPFSNAGRERILKGISRGDQQDSYDFMVRHFSNTLEMMWLAHYLSRIGSHNLEAAIGTIATISGAEVAKYLAHRLIQSADKTYPSKAFQKYVAPVLRPVARLEHKLIMPAAEYLERKSMETTSS